MASELAVSVSATYSKNNATASRSYSKTVDVSGDYLMQGIALVGTVDETLPLGDISTIGWITLKNLDGTNFVLAGADGASYPIKLKAGEVACFRFNGSAIHLKANTAACKVEYTIWPD